VPSLIILLFLCTPQHIPGYTVNSQITVKVPYLTLLNSTAIFHGSITSYPEILLRSTVILLSINIKRVFTVSQGALNIVLKHPYDGIAQQTSASSQCLLLWQLYYPSLGVFTSKAYDLDVMSKICFVLNISLLFGICVLYVVMVQFFCSQ